MYIYKATIVLLLYTNFDKNSIKAIPVKVTDKYSNPKNVKQLKMAASLTIRSKHHQKNAQYHHHGRKMAIYEIYKKEGCIRY